MTGRRVALAGAVAGIGWAAWRRRRRVPRARRRLHAVALLAWLFAASGAQDWDLSVDGILGHIGGFFAGLLDLLTGIVRPIAEALNWVAGQLMGLVYDVRSEIMNIIGYLPAAIYTIGQGFMDIWNNTLAAIENASNVIWYEINNVWSKLNSLVDTVTDSVYQAVTSLISEGLAVGGWLWNIIYNGWIAPIFDFVGSLFSQLYDIAVAAANAALNAAVEVGGWLYDVISSIVGDVIDAALAGFRAIVDVVNGAWDFLVWIATHPLSWFTDSIEHLFTVGEEWIVDHILAAFERNDSHVEDFIDRVFG